MNEAGEYIEVKKYKVTENGEEVVNEFSAQQAVNLALEQVRKEALNKAQYYEDIDDFAPSMEDLDKIIKSLKL